MFHLSRFASFWCAAGLLSAAAPPSRQAASAALTQLPLRFEANQGQAAPEVRYTARAGGYTFALTAHGPAIAIPGSKPVTLSLANSRRAARIEALDQLPVRTDYFIGAADSWRTGVPTYARVRYREVYPGIDVVYYGANNRLEYDLVLQPGARPDAIRLAFDGPVEAAISAAGDLVLNTPAGPLVQKKPVIYQQDSASARREISGRYVMLGRNLAGFQVDRYDRSRTLVIDPVLIYSSYLGGSGKDQINAVKLGPRNWLYIAGQTDTNQITPSEGSITAGQVGLKDAFLAIVDATPGAGYQLIYFSYFGGSNDDAATSVDVDSAGNAYLTGYTNSTDYPVTEGALQGTGAATTQDAFVTVVTPCVVARNFCNVVFGGASIIYSTYLGGTSGSDIGNGIALDSKGLIYVIGNTKSNDFPLTDGAYQNTLWGAQDTFLCKIDPVSGALLYSTYIGGESGLDDGRAIVAGANGLAYFATTTASQNFPVKGFNYTPNPIGGQDIIIGAVDTTKSGDASLVYSTYFGGSGNDEVRAMSLDAKGNLLLTGYTLSTDFPATNDAIRTINSGANDAFVVVFNPSLPSKSGLLYSSYLGGSHGDSGWGIQGDSAGNIWVTGYTLSGDFPMVNAIQPDWGQGTDVFLVKLKPGIAGPGGILFSTYLGATSTYQPTGLALASDGTAYVVGFGYSGLPISDNPIQAGYAGGGSDGFVLVVGQ